MPDRLDGSYRLTPGLLVLVGLTLLVLAILARFFSSTAFEALAAAALAAWLGAAALFAATWSHGRQERVRQATVGVPAVLALLFALVAVARGASVVGLASEQPHSTGVAEQVAGATGTPSTRPQAGTSSLSAPSSPAATATGSAPSAPPSSVVPSSAASSETPTPSPTAAATLPRGRVKLTFTSLTSPVPRGADATATVQATVGTSCSIRVGYLSDSAAAAAGLAPQIVPDSGSVTWTWTIDSAAPAGRWPVRVTCVSRDSTAWWTRSLRIE